MVFYVTDCTSTYCSSVWTSYAEPTGISSYFNNSTTTTSYIDKWEGTASTTDTVTLPYGRYNVHYLQPGIAKITRVPTEQELEAERIAYAKYLENAKKEKEEAQKAAKKARELLLDYLNDENRKRLLDKKPLEVQSKLFNDIKYEIPIEYGRIKVLKDDKTITELCVSIGGKETLPTDDIILTKLLNIMNNEENVLRIANHYNKQENLLARLNLN